MVRLCILAQNKFDVFFVQDRMLFWTPLFHKASVHLQITSVLQISSVSFSLGALALTIALQLRNFAFCSFWSLSKNSKFDQTWSFDFMIISI